MRGCERVIMTATIGKLIKMMPPRADGASFSAIDSPVAARLIATITAAITRDAS